MKALLLIGLCACGARTELAGTKVSNSDAGVETSSGCHDEIIAKDANGASVLAVDGDQVFWGTIDGFVRVHDASGNATLAAESETITSIVLDATYVYYAMLSRIRRVPRGGGVAEDVFMGAGVPSNVALIGGDVFWLDYGQGIAAGSVRENDAPVISMLDTPGGFVVDGAHLFVDCALALVNQQGVTGPLLRANLDGSDLTTLAVDLHQPGSVKAFGGRVYYIEQVDAQSTLHGGVRSIDENGGDPKIEITTDGRLPIDLTVDDDGVYLTTLSQVESALLHGSTYVATTPGVVYEAVRTNATAIYWTIAWTSQSQPPADGATVRKICK